MIPFPSSALPPAPRIPHPRLLGESFKDAQINPSIVVIIIILTIIFFLSGCLHLLIRCLVMRHPRRSSNSIVTLTALQGQLQQLFHLHDSGVEQAFIDTLPVFCYKSVKGLKEGADCAVCLCEFDGDDRLRLLPKCSHAFHMECIDTWLLSHSTCPLCRRSLLPEDHLHHLSLLPPSSAAGFHGLLHDSSSRSSSLDRSSAAAAAAATTASVHISSARLPHERGSSHGSHEEERPTDAGVAAGSLRYDAAAVMRKLELALLPRSFRRDSNNAAQTQTQTQNGGGGESQRQQGSSLYSGKVVSVQLGRFRTADAPTTGSTSAAICGSRRSYSVGSYEYVLDPSNLEVFIAPTPANGKNRGGRTPRRNNHRSTLSECDGSRRWEQQQQQLRSGGIFSSCTAADVSLDISPLLLPYPPHHRHGSRIAGPRNVRLKPHDALPLALCYCAGDHNQVSSERRAFSFRHPIDADAVKLKERAGSRRSLSDVEAYPSGGGGFSLWSSGSSSGGDVEEDERYGLSADGGGGEATPSSGRMSSETAASMAARASLARRTLSWLVGSSR